MKLNRITIENDNGFLRQISTDVNFDTDNYHEWIEALKNYCQNNAVYALAPVQIGIPKRMIYLRNTTSDMTKNKDSNYDESMVLINPVIIEARGRTRFIERCESCLDYVATVDRPYSVEVEYFDVNGNIVHEIFEGFKATVFSHEYDHLNGILHIDLSDDVRKMTWEETKSYREEHPYEILSKDDKFDFDLRKVEIKKTI
jgi:peptide deformylase